MPTRALLIGIDSYPGLTGGLSAAALPGGVAGALALYGYLVEQQGVLPQDIRLHLAPLAGTAAEQHSQALGASFAELKAAIRALRAEGQGTTNRLFVFFSGHGFRFGTDLSEEPQDALVCGDFVSLESPEGRCIRVGELRQVLAGLGPGEQYFFLDCCRNRATREALSLSLGIEMNPSARGWPSQFTLTSTRPDRTAAASAAFMSALLDGLAGAGKAKTWFSAPAQETELLLVRFESLFSYVQARLSSELHQEPDRLVNGDSPGVLKILDPPPRLSCAIHVAGVAPTDSLSAVAWLHQLRAEAIPLPGGEGRYDLLPGNYTMQVAGQGYAVKPQSQKVELYDPQELAFTAAPDPGHSDDHPPRSQVPVTVRLSHPAFGHRLHIEDLAGRKIAESKGVQELLLPGDYQAVLTDTGKRTQIPFEVALDETQGAPVIIPLNLPEPTDETQRALLRVAGETSGFGVPSEALGPIADRSLSLWLSLLAMMMVTRYQGHLARAVRLPPLTRGAGEATLLLLCAAPAEPKARALSAAGDVPLWLAANPDVHGLWSGSLGLRPGAHVLELRLGIVELLLPVHLLPGRVTTLVRVQRPHLPATTNHYLLPEGPGRPELAQVHPLVAMKQLEAAQHAYAGGHPVPDDLRDVDPVTECLSAYSLVRLGQGGRAQAVVHRLQRRFPMLPDLPALARLTGLPAPAAAADAPLVREGLLTVAPTGHLSGYPDPAILDFGSPFTCWRR